MKNIFILGAGRSGTSMLAGLFAKAGYHMGEKLYPGRDTNPKGFFESYEINSINENILAMNLPGRIRFKRWELLKNRPVQDQRWLGKLPLDKQLNVDKNIENRIKEEVSKTPFCYKDPRFSYTLPIWENFTENTVKLVIFRSPASTVKSIMKECRVMPYLSNLKITEKDAYKVWSLMYSHILSFSECMNDIYFFHYEQVLNGDAYEKLEKILQVEVDRKFVDPLLHRNQERTISNPTCSHLYRSLCSLAKYPNT